MQLEAKKERQAGIISDTKQERAKNGLPRSHRAGLLQEGGIESLRFQPASKSWSSAKKQICDGFGFLPRVNLQSAVAAIFPVRSAKSLGRWAARIVAGRSRPHFRRGEYGRVNHILINISQKSD
jgi:hypothetical protein